MFRNDHLHAEGFLDSLREKETSSSVKICKAIQTLFTTSSFVLKTSVVFASLQEYANKLPAFKFDTHMCPQP